MSTTTSGPLTERVRARCSERDKAKLGAILSHRGISSVSDWLRGTIERQYAQLPFEARTVDEAVLTTFDDLPDGAEFVVLAAPRWHWRKQGAAARNLAHNGLIHPDGTTRVLLVPEDD